MNLTVTYLDKVRLPLLHKLYKENYPSGKPKGKEDIVILEADNKMVGAIRIKTYDDCHFLTGMMVIKELRHQNLGSHLLKQLPSFLSFNTSYCLCEPILTQFYLKNNFEYAETDGLPNTIKVKYQRYTKDGKNLDLLIYKKSTI